MDSDALGAVQSDTALPDGDGVPALEGRIVELLAGRAAEELVLGSAGAGAMHDLAQATWIAALIEVSFGLGGELTAFGAVKPGDVPALLLARPQLAASVEGRLQACYGSATGLLRANRAALDAVAARLVEREALSGDEVASLVRQTAPPGIVAAVTARPRRWWAWGLGAVASDIVAAAESENERERQDVVRHRAMEDALSMRRRWLTVQRLGAEARDGQSE